MNYEVFVDYFTKTVNEYNEDNVSVTKYAWWVLDGAHSTRHLSVTDNDATWFVNALSKYLEEYVFRFDVPLSRIVERAVFSASVDLELMMKLVEHSLNEYIPPTSTISILRYNPVKNILELYKLGDSSALLIVKREKNSETVYSVTGDKRLGYWEEFFIEKFKKYIDEGLGYQGARQKLYEDYIIPITKKYLNNLDDDKGYFALSPFMDYEVIGKGDYVTVSLDDVDEFRALLISDGMEKIINPFNVVNGLDELLKMVEEKGWSEVYRVIKDLSYSDRYFKKFGRLKIIDDASGVYVRGKRV